MRGRIATAAVGVLLAAGGCGLSGGGGGGGGGLGEGGRVFVVPHVLETSGRAVQVAAGDVNGDGVLDLLVHGDDPSSIELLLSTSLRESPTFSWQKGKPLARGTAAYSDSGRPHVFAWNTLADFGTADMDGDGCPDLVAAGGAAHQVGVWRCDPVSRSEFLTPVLVDVPGNADRVAVGDLNRDGRPDLVTLDESKGEAHVFLQSSSSPLTFIVDRDPPVIGDCFGLVVCDMDRDGMLDLVTNRPAADAVVVVRGQGGGGWTLREQATGRATGRAMGVGDVDGDGWLDVVVLADSTRDVVCLRQVPSSGAFYDLIDSPLSFTVDATGPTVCSISIDEPGVHFADLTVGEEGIDSSGRAVAPHGVHHEVFFSQPGIGLADMDRDGRLDLVLDPLDPDSDGDMRIVYGSSVTRGGFSVESDRLSVSNAVGTKGVLTCLADLDRDGHVDVIQGDPDFDLLRCGYIADSAPAPNVAYSERLRIVPTAQTTGRGICDVDRDGFPDHVCATTDGLQVRYQDATSPGTFLPPATVLQGACRSVAIGDLNNDGCPDCIVSQFSESFVLLRDPAAPRGFFPPIPVPPPPPTPGGAFRSFALGDCDGDGILDAVAIRESPSRPSLGRGMGNGFFDVFVELEAGISSPVAVAVGDLNGDGRLDLAVCGNGPDGSSVILQDPGVSLKWMAPESLFLQGGVYVAAGDVNGDGRADVVTCGGGGVLVALQSAEVSGRFLPSYALSLEACGGLDLCDVDRDGRLDACFVETATGLLRCFNADPDGVSPEAIRLNGLPPGTPIDGTLVVLADTDGDGRPDVWTSAPDGSGAVTSTLTQFSAGP